MTFWLDTEQTNKLRGGAALEDLAADYDRRIAEARRPAPMAEPKPLQPAFDLGGFVRDMDSRIQQARQDPLAFTRDIDAQLRELSGFLPQNIVPKAFGQDAGEAAMALPGATPQNIVGTSLGEGIGEMAAEQVRAGPLGQIVAPFTDEEVRERLPMTPGGQPQFETWKAMQERVGQPVTPEDESRLARRALMGSGLAMGMSGEPIRTPKMAAPKGAPTPTPEDASALVTVPRTSSIGGAARKGAVMGGAAGGYQASQEEGATPLDIAKGVAGGMFAGGVRGAVGKAGVKGAAGRGLAIIEDTPRPRETDPYPMSGEYLPAHKQGDGVTHLRPLGLMEGLPEDTVRYLDEANQRYYQDARQTIPNEQTLREATERLGMAPTLAKEVLAKPDGELARQATILRAGALRAEKEYQQARAFLEGYDGPLNSPEYQSTVRDLTNASVRHLEVVLAASQKMGTELGRGLQSLKMALRYGDVEARSASATEEARLWDQAAKEIEKAAKTNGQVAPDTLKSLERLAASGEKRMAEEAATGGAAGGGTAAPRPRKPSAVTPEATRAAERAAPDPEMREFLDQLYRQRDASARGDEAAVYAAQKRMDELMDGFLSKARQAKAEKEATKAGILPKAKAPEDFDEQVISAIQQRVNAVVAREGAQAGAKGAGEARDLVDKAFGNAYNTAAQQKLAAKASIEIEKELNRTFGKAWEQVAGEPVKRLVAKLKYGSASEEEFALAESAIDALATQRPDLKKAADRLREQLRKAEAKNAFAQAGDIREMEARSLKIDVSERLAKVKAFLEAGGDLARANEAIAAIRTLGTQARVSSRQFKQDYARQTAMRAVGSKEWNALKPDQRDELLASLLSEGFWEDPRAAGRFAAAMSKPSNWQRAHAYRVASMLSGPPTMLLNALGSAAETGVAVPVRFIEGTQAGGRSLGKQLVTEELAGWSQMAGPALREFANTFQTGISSRPVKDIGRVNVDVLGGPLKPLNYTFRLLAATDDFWRTMNMGGTLRAEARLKAMRTGKNIDDIMLNLVDHPDVVEMAGEQAARRTYQQEPGKFTRAVSMARTGNPVVQTLIPFWNTIANLARVGAERTPYGFVEARKLEMAGDSARAAQRRAEATFGTAFMAGTAALAWTNNITGYGPTDPKERQDWLDQGHQPYSVRIGDKWVSYTNWGSLMIPLSITASVADGIRYRDLGQGDAAARAWRVFHSFSNLFMNVLALRGMSDVINGITDPERYGEKALSGLGSSVVPYGGFLAAMARVFDPEVKEPEDVIDSLKARIPGLSKQVKPMIGQLGEPIERGSTGMAALSPFRSGQEKPESVLQEYQRLRGQGFDVGVGKTRATSIRNVPLTPDEQNEYQQVAGRLVADRLRRLTSAPDYQRLSPQLQARMLARTEESAREMAASQFLSTLLNRLPSDVRSERVQQGVQERVTKGR